MNLSELKQVQHEYLRNENDGTPASYRKCKEIASENFWNVLSTAIGFLEQKPVKPTTIANHYPADSTSCEPCNHCLEASEQVAGIISQLDNAVGLLTIEVANNTRVADAKEGLINASLELGELFGD